MDRLSDFEKFLLESVRSNSKEGLQNAASTFFRGKPDAVSLSIIYSRFKTFLSVYLDTKRLLGNLGLPKKIEQEIKISYLLNSERNERIQQFMAELAIRFKGSNIEIIFLKGAALLSTLYKDDPGARIMADIDVLIRTADFPNAESLLRQNGYREDYEKLTRDQHIPVDKPGLSRDFFSKNCCHYVYYKDGFRLEPHWKVIREDPPMVSERLFEIAQKTEIKNTPISVLPPSGSIFIACTNFISDIDKISRHYWCMPRDKRNQILCGTIFFFYEIKKMIAHYPDEIIWDQVLELSKIAKIEYPVFSLLLLAQKVVKAGIPCEAIDKMQRNFLSGLFNLSCRKVNYFDLERLFLKRYTIGKFSGNKRKAIFELLQIYLYALNPKTYFFIRNKIIRR